MADKPIDSIRIGCVQISIWENTGKKGTFISVTVDKSYNDGKEWKRTKAFKVQDLPLLKLGIDEVLRRHYKVSGVIKPEAVDPGDDF